MKKYIFLLLIFIGFSISLSAAQYIKKANIWGRVGSGFGEGFRKGFEDSLRRQHELELLEREKQIQLEILEKKRRIQIEIPQYEKQIELNKKEVELQKNIAEYMEHLNNF